MKSQLPLILLALVCAILFTPAANAQKKYIAKTATTENADRNQVTSRKSIPLLLPQYDGSKAACDTLNYALYRNIWTIVEYSITATPQYSSGFVNGVNTYADKAKAAYFPNTGANTYVLGGMIAFSRAYSTNPAKIITVSIRSVSGGIPGTTLASKTFTMQQIMTDVNGNFLTNVVFSTPANVGGMPFFMVVDFSGLNWATSHDTLSIQSNQDGETVPTAVWEYQSNSTWYKYDDAINSWGLNISLAVFPVMANVPAHASFTQSATNTCAGYPVTFDAAGSAPASVYSWKFTGGTPGTSNVVNPTVSWATAGTYPVKLYILGGSCNNIDSMISSITIVSSPVPNATATPSAICIGDTSTLGAQNGVFYTWSGFPPGPSPTQIVTPTTTTSYTVTVTGSNSCTASQKVTVVVHPLPDGMAAASPSVICTGGVTLLTSATGMTSYLWDPGGATTSAFTDSPATTTIYTVAVVDVFSCANTDTVRVVVDPCTGTMDADNETWLDVIPNPSNGIIDLVFTQQSPGFNEVIIYNIHGQMVYTYSLSKDISRHVQRIVLSDLSKGIYYLRLTGSKQSVIRKIVIQ